MAGKSAVRKANSKSSFGGPFKRITATKFPGKKPCKFGCTGGYGLLEAATFNSSEKQLAILTYIRSFQDGNFKPV